MVAAWMSADTGVGPAMASGSQVHAAGTAPTFRKQPMKSRMHASVIVRHSGGETQLARRAVIRRDVESVPSVCRTRTASQADHECEVADAVDDERFACRHVGGASPS